MGIDIYARWPEQSEEERKAQHQAWLFIDAGCIGYLREAYHGEPYPSRYLVAEAFDAPDGVLLSAKKLRERLPETLRLAKERERAVYAETDEKVIEKAVKQYSEFVEFCENIEEKTGRPADITASW